MRTGCLGVANIRVNPRMYPMHVGLAVGLKLQIASPRISRDGEPCGGTAALNWPHQQKPPYCHLASDTEFFVIVIFTFPLSVA